MVERYQMDISIFVKTLGLNADDTEVLSVCESENSDVEKINKLVEISNRLLAHAKSQVKVEWNGPNKISATINHPKIRSLENNIKSKIKDHEYYLSESMRYLVQMAQYAAELREIKRAADVDLKGQAEKLMQECGEWLEPRIDAYSSEGLYLFTKDLNIRHYEPQHGIDYSLPIGSYQIYLRYDGTISVYRHKGEFKSGNYIHPHISSSNSVCWGSEHLAPTYWANNFDMIKPVKAILGILQNYNSDSPYRTLADFIQASCGKEAIKAALVNITDVHKTDTAEFWADNFDLWLDATGAEYLKSDEEDEDRCKYSIQLYAGMIEVEYHGVKVQIEVGDLVREYIGDDKYRYHEMDDVCSDWDRQ